MPELPVPFDPPLGQPSTVSEGSKAVPEEAVRAAWAPVTERPARWQYVSKDDVREILEAAAPFIAAQALIQERRRALRLVRRTLVPRGCEPTQDAEELIRAIKGDLDV